MTTKEDIDLNKLGIFKDSLKYLAANYHILNKS